MLINVNCEEKTRSVSLKLITDYWDLGYIKG